MKNTLAENSATKKGILTDVTKCIGCERCVEACVRKNKLPRDFFAHFKGKDGLSANRLTAIVKTEGKKPGTWRMVRRQCMHCQEPSCLAACLVGAFSINADGAVVYDDSKCIGCRYCMIACPFSIPRYEYNKALPYVRKCKMDETCRVEGGLPACVSACPTQATIFGPRDELIKVAEKRIKAEPDLYQDHIYGREEFGGTSVMYISDVPLGKTLKIPEKEQFEQLRLPSLATKSVPALVEPWVWVTPVQFFVVSAGLAGIWLFNRKNRLAQENMKQNQDKPSPTVVTDRDKDASTKEDSHE